MKRIFTQMWKLTPILLILLSLILAGCGSANRRQRLNPSSVTMNFEVEPNPPGVGPSQVTIALTDRQGTPIEEAAVEMTGTMAHDGMQPRFAKAKAGAEGQYVAPFVWSMGGDWALTVKATLADGREIEQTFDLTVMEEMAGDHDHHNQPLRVPNEGAAIRILSPEDGAVFEMGQDIKIEIETDQFNLGAEGNHWHIYVDDQPGQMIMGQVADATLRDLEPGQHQISTYLSVGDHGELEEGATAMVTILGDDGESEEMHMGEAMSGHDQDHKATPRK